MTHDVNTPKQGELRKDYWFRIQSTCSPNWPPKCTHFSSSSIFRTTSKKHPNLLKLLGVVSSSALQTPRQQPLCFLPHGHCLHHSTSWLGNTWLQMHYLPILTTYFCFDDFLLLQHVHWCFFRKLNNVSAIKIVHNINLLSMWSGFSRVPFFGAGSTFRSVGQETYNFNFCKNSSSIFLSLGVKQSAFKKPQRYDENCIWRMSKRQHQQQHQQQQ